MKTYSGDITKLEPNQIFVFGSNTQGRHGKGTALIALKKFGAKYGQAKGLQGQSYAIVTKDLTKKIHPSIHIYTILTQIEDLYDYARANPDKEFLIAYKANLVNLNGYSPLQMKKVFTFPTIPDNIIFNKDFIE